MLIAITRASQWVDQRFSAESYTTSPSQQSAPMFGQAADYDLSVTDAHRPSVSVYFDCSAIFAALASSTFFTAGRSVKLLSHLA